MTTPTTIRLGSKVKDLVSKFEGIATARYTYLNGCERYEVSGLDKDGKPDAYVFDVQQLEVLKSGHLNIGAESEPTIAAVPPAAPTPMRRTGGPRGTTPVKR